MFDGWQIGEREEWVERVGVSKGDCGVEDVSNVCKMHLHLKWLCLAATLPPSSQNHACFSVCASVYPHSFQEFRSRNFFPFPFTPASAASSNGCIFPVLDMRPVSLAFRFEYFSSGISRIP